MGEELPNYNAGRTERHGVQGGEGGLVMPQQFKTKQNPNIYPRGRVGKMTPYRKAYDLFRPGGV